MSNALNKLDALTGRFISTVSASFDAMSAKIDAAIAKAGPMPGEKFIIVPKNGGFSLQENVTLMGGRWEYREVYWSSNRKNVDAAKARREI